MITRKTVIAAGLAAITQSALFGAGEAADSAHSSGLIRAGYIHQENPAPTEDTYATSLGGFLKYETSAWNGVKLGVAGYASQKAGFGTGSMESGKRNLDFLDPNGDSFAYVGEAYGDYARDDLNIRIGRQLIDTPLADTDEIRMLPNTFEAAMATYGGLENTTVNAGFIRRWAGYDSGGDISKFKRAAEQSHGAAVIGITNESISDLTVQGWYYSIDKITDVVYADAAYRIKLCDSTGVELSAQFGHFSEDTNASGELTGTDGNVYGIAGSLEAGSLTLGVAYNSVSSDTGKSVINGLGGGPYYTSMEEWTIDGMEDARGYVGSIELNLADAGLEGVSVSTAYGVFKSAPANVRVEEWDVVAVYEYSPELSADVSYAMIKDRNDNATDGGDGGYNRFLARLSYRF